jgi:hypothetical protein
MTAGSGDGDVDDALTHFFRDNQLGFGAGDILFLGRSGTSGQIVDIFKRLICFVDEEGKSPIHRFVLVTPPTADFEQTQKLQMRLQVSLKASNLAPPGVPEDGWLQLVRLGDLRVQSVVEAFQGLLDRTVVIVNSAAVFRDDAVTPSLML